RSDSIASRSARPGPTTCSWPTKPWRAAGRSRCASGATCSSRRPAASSKRSAMRSVCSRSGGVMDLWSQGMYERLSEMFEPVHDELAARLAPQPGERVLDLGSGTASIAVRAARAGADAVAVDSSAPLLDKVREDAEQEG